MSRDAGIAGRALEAGARAASRMARAVLESPSGREVAAAAVGLAQRGKRRLDEAQARLLRSLGLAAREDYAEVARRMARLKRKMRDLSRRAEANGRSGPAGGARREAVARGREPEGGEPDGAGAPREPR